MRGKVGNTTEERLVWFTLPDKAGLEAISGRELSDEQIDDIYHMIEKGIEAQVDWTMLIQCAIAEVIK